ncbi:MAG TPA: hypothetical protein VHM90_07385, partial [Phycisphaerae bacterium]|nr:hypothetical protein [Phycisphaerae bacterium]
MASRAPNSLFISPLRRWISGITLTLLVLFLGGLWYLTNPARISRLSEALLSRVLGGNVTVKSGRLSFSGTLLLSGVEVRPQSDGTAVSEVPIFSAEQIEARFDWVSLFSGQLSATQLVATTPVFRPVVDRDTGRWNYELLRPGLGGNEKKPAAGAGGISLPVVIVRDAHVRSGEVRQGHMIDTGETIIDGSLTPDAALPTTYHLQFAQMAPAAPGDPAAAPQIGMLLQGTWDSTANTFSATSDNVMMNEALRNGLPRQVREWCEEHHLTGRLAQLALTYNPRDGVGVSIAFDGVSMMTMVEPDPGIGMGEERPAYPLDVRDVRGKIFFSATLPQSPRGATPSSAASAPALPLQQKIRISNLTGEVLGYRFVVDDCVVQGNSFSAPYDLTLRFPGAVLGDKYPPLFMAFM